MKLQQFLEELNVLDEHHRVEAKRSRDMGRSVLETICAFANEPGLNGGHILLGVARESESPSSKYVTVGVPDPGKLQEDLVTGCASTFNRPVRPEITPEADGDKIALVVYVPEAPPADKPIYFTKDGLP